jgi:hypothetical protein
MQAERHEAPQLAETVAGRYVLLRSLARGGAGEVFAARDESSQKQVALKRLLPEALKQRTTVVHFMQEYHALSALRHPRIIDVYDYGVERDVPFYTMELLDGQDLGALSPMPYREACAHLRDVASSLALLHARRLLHRDVSPRNVRRTSDGRCKLLDFGAMVPFGKPSHLIGTPPCIAPEALQGGMLDQRVDLYALGALAYVLLTGRHAYPVRTLGELAHAWTQPVEHPSQRVPELPEALDTLVMSLLNLDPMKRPSSAAEVIDWLSASAELAPDDGIDAADSFLASSMLVGRHNACARIEQRLKPTREGRGSTTLVCADPGQGKSRMLAEAALIAQVSGLTVVRSGVREQPGAAWDWVGDLIRGLCRAAPLDAQGAGQHLPLVQLELAATALEPPASAHNGEAAAQLMAEVCEYVRELSRTRPMLILVDDLHRADELVAALVAALAHQTQDCALALIVSCDSHASSPALTNILQFAATIALAPLDAYETTRLTAAMFGDVPNVERVSAWLFRVAAGSPKLTFELASHLHQRGVVRYLAGQWLLPIEIDEPIPESANAVLRLRSRLLSAPARALAEGLSLRRHGGATADQCLQLSGQPPAAVFQALDELVRAAILESSARDYVFAQDALRKALADTLDPERRQELHARWAELLLAQAPLTRELRLEAGWHLLHTPDELKGAELLAQVGPQLVEDRMSMAWAIPAIERALEVFERRQRPLAERLRLRGLLVMCSYLFDHRLANRYGTQTLDALYPFTGLARAERLGKLLGRRLGFVIAILWTALLWCLRSASARGPSVRQALVDYARSTTALLGLRALTIDAEGTRHVLDRMRALRDAPHPTLATVHAIGQAITLHTEGHVPEARQAINRELTKLQRRTPMQMSRQEQTDLRIGLLVLSGMNECYREQSRALERAAEIERLGTPLAAASALRVRMTYHAYRGQIEHTQHCRHLLELSAIQNGTSWQVEWLSLPIEGLASATWTDLVGLRRAVERLDSLVIEVPSFVHMRDAIRLGYRFRRGDFAEAAELGDSYITQHPPMTIIGWASAYAITALAHVELGQVERAREICELAWAHVDEEDRAYVILYASLEAAHATVLAMLGQRERAEAIFQACVQRMAANSEHERAFVVHEYRARVARLLHDHTALQQALQDARASAIASGNSHVISLAERLTELHGARRPGPASLTAASRKPLAPEATRESEHAETTASVVLRK